MDQSKMYHDTTVEEMLQEISDMLLDLSDDQIRAMYRAMKKPPDPQGECGE